MKGGSTSPSVQKYSATLPSPQVHRLSSSTTPAAPSFTAAVDSSAAVTHSAAAAVKASVAA
jgi:hypothetical protein